MLYTETFQRFCLKMSQAFLQGCLFGENPVIQFAGTVFAAEIFLEVILSGAVVEHLFRHEVAHQFFYIVVGLSLIHIWVAKSVRACAFLCSCRYSTIAQAMEIPS